MSRKYTFTYTPRPSDLWQARMYYAYASYTSIVNVCCIAGSLALIISLWKTALDWQRGAMLLFFLLFTVFQPLLLYYSSAQMLKGNTEELTLSFGDEGVLVETEHEKEMLMWSDFKGMTEKPTLVMLHTESGRGYILTNRILEKKRKEFAEFVREKLKESRTGS